MLLDTAIEQTDNIRRLAFVALYSATMLTNAERSATKPFNPLLGETYEFVTPRF
jgi:oxysterol-binding protein 1